MQNTSMGTSTFIENLHVSIRPYNSADRDCGNASGNFMRPANKIQGEHKAFP